jgi:hypothetical protein
LLAGTAVRCNRLMARRISAGQKADGNPQHDGAARSVRAINDYIDPYKTPNALPNPYKTPKKHFKRAS